MCEPTSIALTGAGTVQAGGAGLSAWSRYQEGQARGGAMDYNAALAAGSGESALAAAEARAGAWLSEAGLARERGKLALKRHQRETDKVAGARRVARAAQGVRLDSGSSLEASLDMAGEAAVDEALIQYKAGLETWRAQREADLARWRGEVEAARAEAAAGLLAWQADQARYAGRIGAAATLLGGVGSVGRTAAAGMGV